MNSETPLSPGFRGAFADAISESAIIPAKPSVSRVTPNAWKDFPSFITSKMILSPTFAVIVGVLSASPGSALNAKVLKSLLSIKDNDELIYTPVRATGPEPAPDE